MNVTFQQQSPKVWAAYKGVSLVGIIREHDDGAWSVFSWVVMPRFPHLHRGHSASGGTLEEAMRAIREAIDTNEASARRAGAVSTEKMSTPSHWAEDPRYPVEDWQLEVANGDTRLGYADWVEGLKARDIDVTKDA